LPLVLIKAISSPLSPSFLLLSAERIDLIANKQLIWDLSDE
jgi:hypothetical protein